MRKSAQTLGFFRVARPREARAREARPLCVYFESAYEHVIKEVCVTRSHPSNAPPPAGRGLWGGPC
jgi:hypothetical protein